MINKTSKSKSKGKTVASWSRRETKTCWGPFMCKVLCLHCMHYMLILINAIGI